MPPAEDLPPEEPLELEDAHPPAKKRVVDLARIKSEAAACAKAGTAAASSGANLIADGVRLWKLRRQLAAQRVSLGEALADEKWGDAAVLQELDALHAEKPTALTAAAAKNLHLKLAAAGEKAEAVPEAAKREWNKTRALAEQLAALEAKFAAAKSQLIPRQNADRIRLAIVGVLAFLLLVGFLYLVWPSSTPSNSNSNANNSNRPPQAARTINEPEVPIDGIAPEARLTASLGLVACGYELDTQSGEHFELPVGHGTGFAVTSDGWLFTNKHVVEKTWELHKNPAALAAKQKEMEGKARTGFASFKPRVWVFFGPDKYPAEMVHVSGKYDFAILKTDRRGPYFRLRSDAAIPRNQKVFALGFPGAAQVPLSEAEDLEQQQRAKTGRRIEDAFKPRDFVFVLTNGVVSRVADETVGAKWVQHNAAINPGNSGGPLVSEDGSVVGINTLLIKDSQGVFFSLGIPQLKPEFERHVSNVTWK